VNPRLFWGLWLIALAGGVFIFGSLTYDRAVWVVFVAAEAWGAYSPTAGDTLSEFAGWARTEFAPRPAGNWLAAAIIALCAWHAGFVASFGYAGEGALQVLHVGGVSVVSYGPNAALGSAVSVLITGLLVWHFLGGQR
jgi:hypothetical protein